MTKIISGFPAIGKTHLFFNSRGLRVLDSDSSSFSWGNDDERHPDFPENYIEHIKDNLIGIVDYILVSSHDEVRQALNEHGLEYTIVYPDIELKEEYIKRFRDRGNSEVFISFISRNWDNFIKDIESETFPNLIKLGSGEYLSDVSLPKKEEAVQARLDRSALVNKMEEVIERNQEAVTDTEELLYLKNGDFEVWEQDLYGLKFYHVNIENYLGLESLESFVELYSYFAKELYNYLTAKDYTMTKKDTRTQVYQTRAISIEYFHDCYWVFLEGYKSTNIWDLYHYLNDVIEQIKEVIENRQD